ncbi:MAG: hypothetical protein II802_04275, partial [Clostridia bacterium]|nr:hypothetical protein [Clostridia bacterium]
DKTPENRLFYRSFTPSLIEIRQYSCFAQTRNLRKTSRFQVQSSFVGAKFLHLQSRGMQLYWHITNDEAKKDENFALKNHFVLIECKSRRKSKSCISVF